MLFWVKEFYKRFIVDVPSNKLKAPPENFFHVQRQLRYATFLEMTKQLAQSAQLVAELTHEDIQRSPYNMQFFL